MTGRKKKQSRPKSAVRKQQHQKSTVGGKSSVNRPTNKQKQRFGFQRDCILDKNGAIRRLLQRHKTASQQQLQQQKQQQHSKSSSIPVVGDKNQHDKEQMGVSQARMEQTESPSSVRDNSSAARESSVRDISQRLSKTSVPERLPKSSSARKQPIRSCVRDKSQRLPKSSSAQQQPIRENKQQPVFEHGRLREKSPSNAIVKKKSKSRSLVSYGFIAANQPTGVQPKKSTASGLFSTFENQPHLVCDRMPVDAGTISFILTSYHDTFSLDLLQCCTAIVHYSLASLFGSLP